MRRKLASADSVVAMIAARQHGVVALAQLLDAGLSEAGIRRRVATARLHRIHRGVYAVGHPGLSLRGSWKAATLACGAGAVLSHRSAAELWGMLGSSGGPAHVTVPVAGGRARRDRIIIHRRPGRAAAETTGRDGIPVTRPTRTLIDVRSTLPPGELRRAVRQAEIDNLPIDLDLIVPDRTTSELEYLFLTRCRRAGLPPPEVGCAGRPVSRRLPVARGAGDSRNRRVPLSPRLDRIRGRPRARQPLLALGYEVLRFTYRQVVDEPRAVIGLVQARLTRGRSSA